MGLEVKRFAAEKPVYYRFIGQAKVWVLKEIETETYSDSAERTIYILANLLDPEETWPVYEDVLGQRNDIVEIPAMEALAWAAV